MDVFALFLFGAIAWLVYKVVDWLMRIPMVGGLGSKYILITGCDTGFGHAAAKKLDGLGCHVIAGCLTEKGETDLRKICSSRLHTVSMDVSKPDSVHNGLKKVQSILPRDQGLWGVVNNAGISGRIGPSDWLRVDDYKQVMDVNFYGLVEVTRLFLPLVKKAGGRIVNTASMFGRFSMAGSSPYCVSKFCVEAFSDAVRREMHPFGVSVHLIEPGFHKTNMTNVESWINILNTTWDEAPDHVKQEYGDEYLEQAVKSLLTTFVSSLVSDDISGVVDSYIHALLGRYPRCRYLIGLDANYLFIPITWLPTWLGDWVLDKVVKDKPIPAAATR